MNGRVSTVCSPEAALSLLLYSHCSNTYGYGRYFFDTELCFCYNVQYRARLPNWTPPNFTFRSSWIMNGRYRRYVLRKQRHATSAVATCKPSHVFKLQLHWTGLLFSGAVFLIMFNDTELWVRELDYRHITTNSKQFRSYCLAELWMAGCYSMFRWIYKRIYGFSQFHHCCCRFLRNSDRTHKYFC